MVSSSVITDAWSAVSGADEYEVYCDVNSAPTTLYATVSGTSTTITGLTNETLYYVRLKAKNSTGVSSYSAVASGKPTMAGLYDGAIDAAHKIGIHNLASSISFINANAIAEQEYFIILGKDESVSGFQLLVANLAVKVTILGSGGERVVRLNSSNGVFRISAGNTLVLDKDVTFVGKSVFGAKGHIIELMGGGATLVMNEGSKLMGNTNYGAVYIQTRSTFIMNGGVIRGNTSQSDGGGVDNVRDFIMKDGVINGNTSSSYGGGVGNRGIFSMCGGIISGNTASKGGGGVDVGLYEDFRTFKKMPSVAGGTNSGIIYGSEAVGIDASGFPLKNTAGSDGGDAIHISGRDALLMPASRRNITASQTDYIDTTTGQGLSTSGDAPFGE
jgi:hypothetical protein